MPFARDPHGRTVATWETEPVTIGYGDDVAGRGPLGNRIARVVSRALRDARDAGPTRGEIAQAMTAELGRPISAAQLDKWASEAADEHRIPLDAFVALIRVTRQHDLLGFVPALFGFAVVPASYVDLIELQQIQQNEERMALRKAQILARVRGDRP